MRTLARTSLKSMVPVIAAGLMALSALPASAEVFTIGDTFTVTGDNTPGSFSQLVTFQPGTTSLDGGALNLTISIVPVGDAAQSEWAVFTYQSANGDPLSQPGQNWDIHQIGLPAAVAGNFIGDFTQFLDANGTAFNQTNHIFNQGFISNPVPGGLGNGEGTLGYVAPFPVGPVFDLSAFSDPFSIVTNALGTTDVYGFVQALEFAPQVPVSPTGVPEPGSVALLAGALLGLGLMRRGRK